MRKILLMAVSFAFIASTLSAQSEWQKAEKNVKKSGKTILAPVSSRKATQLKDSKAVTSVVTKTLIGTSSNIYTSLLSQKTSLSANPDLNMIAFYARTNLGAAGAGNKIRCSFSTDGGLNFDTTSILSFKSLNGFSARYPSGVIVNPTGNTNPQHAFAVSTCPLLTPSTFGGSGFSSIRFDNTLYDEQATKYTTDTAGGVNQINGFPYLFLQTRGTKVFAMGNANVTNASNYYTTVKGTFNYGVLESDSITWHRSYVNPTFGVSAGIVDAFGLPGMVMDANGQNGYIVYIGRNLSASDPLSFQPIIYKTTDGGATWAPDATFNWGDLNGAYSFITDLSDVNRPFFGTILDILMDKDNRVHFQTYINPAASNNADSLSYSMQFTNVQGFIYDTYQTATGWAAQMIDTIFSKDATIYTGSDAEMTLDERFQASKSPDGSILFFAYLETNELFADTNAFPDIIVKTLNLNTNTLSDRVNITANTNLDGDAHWMVLSDMTIPQSGGYLLPMVVTKHGSSDVDPVNHYYVGDVVINADGTLNSIADQNPLGNIAINPNPTSDICQLSFNGQTGDFKVNIFNSIGSLVSSNNYTIGGTEIKTIDLSKMPNGIYMVEISNNTSKITKKVIKF